MAKTLYAWTDIKYADKDGEAAVLKAGESVTADKLGIDDDEFEQLKEAKAVRENKFPDIPADFPGSPREFMIKELNRQLEETESVLSDDDIVAAENEAEGEVG